MKIEESVNKLNEIVKDYQEMDKEMMHMETEDEDIEAIEAIVAAYKRLVQENLDLVDLYKRTANHLRKKGNEELALYFLAQINKTPSFGTMDLYDNWINRSKVEELKVKIHNGLVKNFGEYRANQFQIDRYFMEL